LENCGFSGLTHRPVFPDASELPAHVHACVTIAPGLRREHDLGFIDIDSVDTDPMHGWGAG
jgi:hypothetical protein